MSYITKDVRLLAEAYDDLDSGVERAVEARELHMIRGMIDNVSGYVDYLEGIRLENPNTKHEPLSKFREFLAKNIGPGMIGEWRQNDYRKEQ